MERRKIQHEKRKLRQQALKELQDVCQTVCEKITSALGSGKNFLNFYLILLLYFVVSGLSFMGMGFYPDYISASQLESFLIAFMAYKVCPRDNKAKSFLMSLCLYLGYILATDNLFTYVSTTQWALEIVFFFLLSVFQILKKYEIKSDKFNKDNVFILMYKPKKPIEYIHSLLGSPVSSMSIVCGDNWYMYKRNKSTLQVVNTIPRKFGDYILIDTGTKIDKNITNELDSLVGNPARKPSTLFIRANCIRTFRPVLKILGERWRIGVLDFIPSIYLLKRLRHERRDLDTTR